MTDELRERILALIAQAEARRDAALAEANQAQGAVVALRALLPPDPPADARPGEA